MSKLLELDPELDYFGVDKMNNAESLIRKDLIERGFAVSQPRKFGANGIDLTAMKNGEAFTIEVKTIVRSKRSKMVKPVLRAGRQCDWVALVDGRSIIYQPMADHLRCCGKAGARGVTALLKLKEMLIAGDETGDVK